MTPVPAQDAPLHRILRNTSEALRDLETKVADLETVLLAAVSRNTGATPTSTNVQQMDLILQTVDEIASLMERIADATSPTVRIAIDPALTQVRLQRLRTIVAGGAGHPDIEPDLTRGHVMLF